MKKGPTCGHRRRPWGFARTARVTHFEGKNPPMLKRRLLQTVITLMITSVASLAVAQPANAAKIVPAGQSGSACGAYKFITDDVYYQSCVFTSWNPPYSRTWFQGFFGNRGTDNPALVVYPGYHADGNETWRSCNRQLIVVWAGKISATDAEGCMLSRTAQAVQASVKVYSTLNQSPTLHIRM